MSSESMWAVVLGVSSGTGAAAARALARDAGLNIAGFHRGHYQSAADELEQELRGLGVKVLFRKADAGTADGATNEILDLRERLGRRRVKLLLHSIANASVGEFLTQGDRRFVPRKVEKTFSSMAHSFTYWVQGLHSHDMLSDCARLLALTNAGQEVMPPGGALIVAAKAALEQYVRYLALELGPLGHRVNALKFGTVATPALARVFGEEATRMFLGLHDELNPAGRICTVEDVAKQIVYLTRPESEWFNGAVIDFSGGMALRGFQLLVDKQTQLAQAQRRNPPDDS